MKPRGDADPQPHVIRLRGRWSLTAQHLGEVRAPVDLASLFAESPQRDLQLRRRFGCPSNLDPNERVELVIDPLDAAGDVSLNAQPLGPLAPAPVATRFDVTLLLQPRNELLLDLRPPREQGSFPMLDVRLEIFELSRSKPWSGDSK